MSFEEEFDRIIKQKAEEAGFPFDEKNWEKARGMLDAERTAVGAKSLSRVYLLALLVLGLGTLAWFILPLSNTAIADKKIAAAKAPVKAEDRNLTADEASYYQIIKSAPAATADPATARTRASVSKNHSVPEAATHTATAASPAKSEALIVRADNKETTLQTPAQENATVGELPAADGKTNENITANPLQNTAPVIQVTPVENNNRVISNVQATNDAAVDPQETPAQVPAAEAMAYEPLSPVYTGIPAVAHELMPVPFYTIKDYDDDYYHQKKFKTHFMNVEAGAAYLAGWDVKGGKDGKGFNWFAGINYGVYLSKKISIGAGLQAYNIGHISKPFYTNVKTEYGFGSASTFTVITTTSLLYAAVPVKLGYQLNAQNQLGLGVNMAMLVNARNQVETYGTSDNVAAVKTKNSGVYHGVNTNNIMLSAFYKTQAGKRLCLNAEVICGVSDIFSNLAATNNERALGLRLGLQYTLFDK